jgi:methylmalonyl-CoA mutase N-terminal domain/subunit
VAQRAIESEEGIVVGVNAFAEDGDEQRPQAQVIDPQAEAEQVARTRAVRAGRDATLVAETTAALEAAATGTENVVPRIRACVEAGVTLGEISAALRGVWGEYRP